MESEIFTAAYQLAIYFTDESNIPRRFKSQSFLGKQMKVNPDSLTEIRFKEIVNYWKELIQVILSRVENDQAWRFINLSPMVNENVKQLTHCKDFIDFTSLFIQRRDKENGDSEEIGRLSMLYTAFQKKIEEKIEETSKHK